MIRSTFLLLGAEILEISGLRFLNHAIRDSGFCATKTRTDSNKSKKKLLPESQKNRSSVAVVCPFEHKEEGEEETLKKMICMSSQCGESPTPPNAATATFLWVLWLHPASSVQGSAKRISWKRGPFKNVPFLEVLEKLEIRDIVEIPQSVENGGDTGHFLENLEILEIPPAKRPLS